MMLELNKHSWKDINLKEYKKIVEINNRELDSVLEKNISVLAVLLGVSEDVLYGIGIAELKSLLKDVEWINKEEYTYTNKIKNLDKLVIDGIEYTVNADINKFTVAQYLDFQTFWDKRNEYMGNLLAVFIIPKGHKYNEGYDVIELADRLEEVFSLDDWNDVCFFFLNNWLISTKASLLYSVWELNKMIWKTKNKNEKEEMKKIRKQLLKQIRSLDL